MFCFLFMMATLQANTLAQTNYLLNSQNSNGFRTTYFHYTWLMSTIWRIHSIVPNGISPPISVSRIDHLPLGIKGGNCDGCGEILHSLTTSPWKFKIFCEALSCCIQPPVVIWKRNYNIPSVCTWIISLVSGLNAAYFFQFFAVKSGRKHEI